MIGAAQKYRELVFELRLERAASDSDLSQEMEARYAGALDRCWHAMSEEEQEAVESAFSSDTKPAVAEEPNLRDRELTKGATELPRIEEAA